MSKHRGRVTRALAAKLQAQFPSISWRANSWDGDSVHVVPLLWQAEHLFPATGAYRTDVRQDCARWEGFALGVRQDGTTYTKWAVHGYTTMSELIKPGTLTIHADGEVTNEVAVAEAA